MTSASPIRSLRLEAGLRLNELARLIDYTPTYLSSVENGRHVPSRIMRIRLAKVLGERLDREINADDLLIPDPEPPEGESSPSTPPAAQALQHCVA